MNIRKFIGATSRDALRLVREALGPDAVVLSNRAIDDGTVEIVALADSDLASIAPKSREGSDQGASQHQGFSQGFGGQGSQHGGQHGSQHNGQHASQHSAPHAAARQPRAAPAPVAAPRSMPAMQGNPYASGGLPDVFSSVFGASPEAGVDAPSIDEAPARPPAVKPGSAAGSGASTSISASGSSLSAMHSASMNPTHGDAPRLSDEIRADLLKATSQSNAANAAQASHAASASHAMNHGNAADPLQAQRTMAESNPWLIDHARRIADKQQQQVQRTARHTMTPSGAAARGFGSAVDTPNPLVGETPEWAREAAQVAARRAAQRMGVDEPRPAAPSAASVSEAIKARMEQVMQETVMNELASMRGMMEEHFAGLLWADRQRRNPMRASLTKHLFAAGFSAQLVQMMVDNLPDDIDGMEAGMEWIHSVLASNLPILENEDDLMEKGGVFALMGPTGVGKTTTTAKLAARCVMRFGASKVALLTTDSYRIGGHEQLRIFGKILGVSVHAVKDGADLQLALAELRNKHIVLIDTIGMSQRDRLVSEQIAMLCRAGQPVKRLLLLNATSHGDTLNEVVQAYQSAPDQEPLAGCILTKLDEATNLGGVLDTVIRYKLPVHYVSTGQKVPENLYVATRKFLIKSAFCVPRDNSPFVPADDEIPGLLSALTARSTAELHEVRFG
ncbi:flagellar biosynthesis protein FlhF [Paraburkholderia sp.]|uniref:flagellar biosynthesis protein FlhF n=1 Tax=Paraburkholderia sp. TaxID=1926495 RepID=UPI0023A541D8|nr:flagellar biosynthesis protein FlhF [Paraburkholderia sp.]MDE1181244.1 flagellar biosynthesis protein FlhF [Paraburkholderia sp.]